MQWSDVSVRPSPAKLRQFAALWLVFFSILAWWRGSSGGILPGVILVLVALTVGFLGLLKPATIRPVYSGWMVGIFPIGWVVSRLVLAAVYYVIFTPLGIFFRIIGRDPLQLRSKSQASYWAPRPAAESHQYLRPF
jgi:hypothetical protein